MSVSLTDIASLTAWTFNTVYDSTHYFFRDVDFEAADEGSDFPDIRKMVMTGMTGAFVSTNVFTLAHYWIVVVAVVVVVVSIVV